jgi:hypothetical protein
MCVACSAKRVFGVIILIGTEVLFDVAGQFAAVIDQIADLGGLPQEVVDAIHEWIAGGGDEYELMELLTGFEIVICAVIIIAIVIFIIWLIVSSRDSNVEPLGYGSQFNSLSDAAIDFARTTNGISIETGWEFATYFYSWTENGVEYFSYTKPHTNEKRCFVFMEPRSAHVPIPSGSKIAGYGHTHGAYTSNPNFANDNFSGLDDPHVGDVGFIRGTDSEVPLFLATPNGSLRRYNVVGGDATRNNIARRLGAFNGHIPHDRNHPDANCKENCALCRDNDPNSFIICFDGDCGGCRNRLPR